MKDDYAFPRVTKLGEQAPGMELRDWFAGMAMQGLIAKYGADVKTDHAAVSAICFADSMMIVRELSGDGIDTYLDILIEDEEQTDDV